MMKAVALFLHVYMREKGFVVTGMMAVKETKEPAEAYRQNEDGTGYGCGIQDS